MQVKSEDSNRLSALKKEINAGEAELTKLKKSAAGLMQQAEKLQGQIDNAGGPKMKKQKQAVSELQQVGLSLSQADLRHAIAQADDFMEYIGKESQASSASADRSDKQLPLHWSHWKDAASNFCLHLAHKGKGLREWTMQTAGLLFAKPT